MRWRRTTKIRFSMHEDVPNDRHDSRSMRCFGPLHFFRLLRMSAKADLPTNKRMNSR